MNEKLKRDALFITSLASFINPFMGSSTNIMLPSIAKDLNLNAITLGWVGLAFLLSSSIFLIPFGKLGDIYGRKKMFLYGFFIYGISSFFCAISCSAAHLIIFRILQGLGGAMFFGISIALLSSIYPPEERGKALGINASMVYIGLSTGPFLGGFLSQILSWRSIFFINFLLTFFLFFITKIKLKGEWADARNEKYDFLGATFLVISFFTMQIGLSFLNKRGYFFLILSFVLFLSFALTEKKKTFPIFDLNLLFKNTLFLFSNLSAFINYSSTFAIGFLLSLYLQYVKGFSPLKAGLILIIQPLLMAVSSPVVGKLSDKKEPRILSSFGMFLSFFGMLLVFNLNIYSNIYLVFLILILFGFGNGFFASPNTNAIMGSVEKKYYGIATGTLSTMRSLGMVTSMSIATLFLGIFLKNEKISKDTFELFLYTIKYYSIIFSALLLLGIFTSLVRGKMHKRS